MKKITIVTLFFALTVSQIFAQKIYHKINADVSPYNSELVVIDTILFGDNFGTDTVFELNAALKITGVKNGAVTFIKKIKTREDVGMDRNNETEPLEISKYLLEINNAGKPVIIEYKGTIDSPIEQSEENYQRGFSQSPGIICEKGVYLAGSTYWVPTFNEKLFGFELSADLPEGWSCVSQGERKTRGGKYFWHSPEPQEEAFLIAAKFTEYEKNAGAVKAMAFLRAPDEALADKYLETTAQYLEMYSGMLGAYPYKKFALVENFWETGYGMPSFTLLGEKIIRFPFILHSSYPHELLHNWWGNSVYVDFSKGNWCEGITAYMADHLIKEQRGAGAEYRRSTLQRFTDYVNSENDFPAAEFKSRYDGASEAIGYGKTLMMWHMLRQAVGDENFLKSFGKFYRDYKFKFASFDDIKNSFETVTGENFDWFFKQWVERKGAPQLALTNAVKEKTDGGFVVKFQIEQIQPEEPFVLDVPVALFSSDKFVKKKFRLSSRKQTFTITTKFAPVKIAVDPQFDVMRRLSPEEIPPALTKAFGSKNVYCILPSESEYKDEYKKIAESWIKRKQGKILFDNEVNNIPQGATVWIFGRGNKWTPYVNENLKIYSSEIGKDSLAINGKKFGYADKSFVLTVRNSSDNKNAVVWLATENKAAVPGLIRKLPHYGKYSYLAFEGDEPVNVFKGAWESVNSPLVYRFSDAETSARLPEEKALAYLKPVFSGKRMLGHVRYLASAEMKGRGLGTSELAEAAEYIKRQFEQSGLKPAFNGSYFQKWEEPIDGKNFEIINVAGYIPGSADSLKNAPLIISAHYDHLGLGWPDVYKGNEGKIHFGADDNASGVAVILELAKILGKNYKPARPVYFVAFSGEEEGLKGSQHFVNNLPEPIAADKIIADLNFDTVGRLNGKKIMILNSETAREWKFIFMGTDYVTGIKTDLIKQQLDASDQKAFIEKGIPAVQFFGGPNKDYHKPTDTVDKIDVAGLVKVATVGKEVLDYLANRTEPLTSLVGKNKPVRKAQSGGKARKVKTGVVPDFSFDGKGVKVSDLIENSPAQKAGMKTGDVIVKVNDTAITDLRSYSNVLKKFSPGEKAVFNVLRNGKQIRLEVVFEAK